MSRASQGLPAGRAGQDASKRAGYYLRGLAMACVLVFHYRCLFLGAAMEREGYATAMLGIFFVLAGHAARLTLEKPVRAGRGLGAYYLSRAARLYPIYWAALAWAWALSGASPDLWAVLGLRSPFWFVHAIVQCSLVAPVLHRGLARLGPWRFVCILILATAAVNAYFYAVDPLRAGLAFTNLFCFRSVVLGHVLLFGAGMVLGEAVRAACGQRWWNRAQAGPALAASQTGAAGVSGVAQAGRGPQAPGRASGQATANVSGLASGLVLGRARLRGLSCAAMLAAYVGLALAVGVGRSPLADLAASAVFMAATFAVCALATAWAGWLPLRLAFEALGRYSYAIYLFEPTYHYVMVSFGVKLWTLGGAGVYTAALPLFVGAAALVEKAAGGWSNRVRA